MKYVATITFLLIWMTGCKKEMNFDSTVVNTAIPDAQSNVTPIPQYRWTQLPTGFLHVYPYTVWGNNTLVFPVGDDIYLASSTGFEFVHKFNKATEKFQLHTPTNPNSLGFSQFIPGHHFLFSYNGMIYGGLADNGSDTSYFFALDPVTSDITPKRRFPGVITNTPVSFVMGSKGYVVSGYNASTQSQVWEYDFISNTWTNKGISPLGKRNGAIARVIDNKVYMGLGYTLTQFNGQPIYLFKKDWIQYTPGSSWVGVKADFPGEGRTEAQGYVLDGKAFVGFGKHYAPYSRLKDLWRYNPANDTWRQEQNWPGFFGDDDEDFYSTSDRNVSFFTDGAKGFAVKGSVNQVWRYSTSSIVIQ